MKRRHLECFGGQVDPQNLRPLTRHGIRQDAATATNVKYLLSLKWA